MSRPHNFLDNYGRPEFKLPYRWNDDTPLSMPLGPKSVQATSPYLIGIIDIRWDNPSIYAEHNGLQVLGVNIYRAYDSPEATYTQINTSPVGALYYRDQTKEVQSVSEDPVSGGRFIAGTNATGDWIIHTYHKSIVIPGTNGQIAQHPKHVVVQVKPTAVDSFQTVPAWRVVGETGEVYLINRKVYNHVTNRLDDPVLPILSQGGEVRITYTYIDGWIQTDINRKIYYKATTVAFDPDKDLLMETPLSQAEAVSLYDMERIDWIWAEAIRRNRWILEQGGERVKLFIRKWAGERCPCWDEQYRQSKNDCTLCFPAGTEITMSDFTRKPIENIVAGDYVLTHKGRSRKVVVPLSRNIDEDLVKIRSIHGISLTPTKEHPLLILKKKDAKCIRQVGCVCTGPNSKGVCNKKGWINSCSHTTDNLVQWIPAEEVEKGDYLVTPIPLEESESFNKDEVRFLGYYAAEGWTSKRDSNSKEGGMTKDDKRVLFGFNRNELSTCIQDLKDRSEKLGHKICVTDATNTENGVTVTVASVGLTKMVLDNVGKYSKFKVLSERLVKQNLDNIKSFVGAYFNGDGCLCSNELNTSITSSSASYQMSRQIHIMLYRIGITSNFITRTRLLCNPLREGYHTSISHELKVPKSQINLVVGATKYQRVVSNKKAGKCFITGNYVFYPVKEVSQFRYSGKVYNMEVEEDNSYIANGVAAHNCYGTGYVGGYEGSYDIIVAPPETEKTVQLMDMGLHVNYDWNSWTGPYPLLNDRDFIVRQNNDRYSIAHVNPQGARGAIFQQHFVLAPLDQHDIRYQVPINGGLTVPPAWNAYRTAKPSDASPVIPDKPEIPEQYLLKGRTVTYENIVF